ncbi:hypothetical protein HOR61_gp62 [Escherichia phage vB_EcoS-IME253]|uniref:Lipoprotein n=2 Tax=Rtpvirus TaxID=1920864 RepID=A0A1P8DUT1_9CAUD|nr:hypothetical protein HOR61_gp62 [Escherichia phage vB_EcoS-IME253]APU93262.1 hypothetical protein [Escherichia phage vB_EcoS-IME253]UMO77956.1 hypothetical protein [Escherichia phage ZL19]
MKKLIVITAMILAGCSGGERTIVLISDYSVTIRGCEYSNGEVNQNLYSVLPAGYCFNKKAH